MTPRTRLYGYLGGFLASEIGTSISVVALPWLVLVSTGSASRTGVIGFAAMAPFVTVQALGGPIADTLGYRRASVAGNLGAALTLATIPALSTLHSLGFAVLTGLVAVSGAARGLAEAASNPIVPALAIDAGMALERAAGLFSGANRTGLLLGLPVGGALVAMLPAADVIAFDATSFAVIAVVVAAVVPGELGRSATKLSTRTYGAQLAEGARFLSRDRLLLAMAGVIAVTNLLDQAYMSVLLPLWARDRVHHAVAIGIIGGAAGVGLLAGVLLGAWLVPKLPRRQTYIVAFLIAGTPPLLATAATVSTGVVAAVTVISGIAGGLLNPINGAVLYERVPDAFRARVLGAVKASAWIGIPFGPLLAGVFAESTGLTTTLLGCATLMLAATLTPFVFPAWRGLDRAPIVHLEEHRHRAA